MSEIDEGLRAELQRPGRVGFTSMQELTIGPQELDLAAAIQDSACCAIEMIAPRLRAMTSRGLAAKFSTFAATSGSDDCRRHCDQKNGATNRAALQPNAGPEIRDLDGRVRDFRRTVDST